MNNVQDGAMDLQRSYSAYLGVRNISEQTRERLTELAKDFPFLKLHEGAVEIEYIGRDTNRFVLHLLLGLARLIEEAEGEIKCEISGDVDELSFEFYRIRNGHLYRQRAEVARLPEELVTEQSL